MKPIIIKTNPPIMVDNFPNNLFNLFPNIKPKYVNIKAISDLNWAPSSDVTIQRSGVFTEYPWPIGKIGTKLKIPTSHVYGQVAGGDVWLTFDSIGTPAKSIYLSTYGNNAFIQTGHSNGSATEDEQKIIANIIFYTMSQRYS